MGKFFTFFIYDIIYCVDKISNCYTYEEMRDYEIRMMIGITGLLSFIASAIVLILSLFWDIDSRGLMIHTIVTLCYYVFFMFMKNSDMSINSKIHLTSLIISIEYLTLFVLLYSKLTVTYWFMLLLIVIPITVMSNKITFYYIVAVSIITFTASIFMNIYNIVTVDYTNVVGAILVFSLILAMLLLIKVSYVKILSSRLEHINLIDKQKITITENEQKLIEKNKKLLRLAFYDELTGLPNRRNVLDTINDYINADKRITLVCFNIDNFKEINDVLGHNIADDLLKEVSKRFQISLNKDDILGRLSGNEYGLLIPRDLDNKAISKYIYQLMELQKTSYHINNYEINITFCAGIGSFPNDAANLSELIIAVDSALYEAQKNGKSSLAFYDENIRDRLLENLNMENYILKALEKEEFFLHYQPIICCEAGCVKSVEALCRWNNETLGLVSPAKFIPVVERIGIINELGLWIVQEAARMAKKLERDCDREVRMSINVSVIQLQRGDFVQKAKEIVDALGVPSNQIIFEITESVFSEDASVVKKAILEMHNEGFYVAIDDFGTGYSSLSYLANLPIDILKIDKSFIDVIGSSKKNETIVEALVSVAHVLDVEVTCEGVEEEKQMSYLRSIDCNYVQGYYYSKPIQENELIAYVNEHKNLSAGCEM